MKMYILLQVGQKQEYLACAKSVLMNVRYQTMKKNMEAGMSEVDHTKAKEMAKFIAGGYDSGYERDLADAYLDLTAKVELMEAALEYYASQDNWQRLENTNSIITDEDLIKPTRGTSLYPGHKYGGKRARETLAKVKNENK